MKKVLFISSLVMTAFFAANAMATTTKVLVNIVQERGDSSSSALIKETEMMIARGLLNKRFDVMTSDDFSARNGFSRNDVEIARSGSIPELRKAAGFNNAAYIFSAKAATNVNQENVLNMTMSKAVTSVAWRIVRTSNGGTIDLGSVSFSSSGRSAGEASASTFRKMSDEMTQIIAKKLPATLPAKRAEELSGYKASLTPRPEPVKAPEPAPVAQTTVAQATAQTPSRPAATASEGPEIVILNPPATRGFIPVVRKKELNIEGMAIDPVGISEVRINGNKVAHDQEGRFSHLLDLKSDQDHVLIMAVNNAGKMASKDLTLDRQQDRQAPELVLLRPDVTRGFQIALPPQEKSTTVEGIVKDDSDILFVRVNDQKVSISHTGHFVHKLALNDSTGGISIEAADVHGNINRKTLEITRGDGNWSVSPDNGFSAGGSGRKPVLWGLAIGVSSYSSSSINLKYADQDALNLEKFFKGQEGKSFAEVHFKTLVNRDVTRNSIIEAITHHLGQAAPNDIIFVFLAGHGTQHRQSGSYYFMPSDADFDNLLSTGLRMSDFEESVKILSKNVDKIIVAMDTCHSGALKVGLRSVGGGEDLANAISTASGLYILSASKAGEASLESDEFKLDAGFTGHGAFTYALVKAMRGQADYDKDDYVSLNEMFQYVARQVPRLTNGRQHPYFRMQGTDLPLVKIK